jgi:hypothetical protein
MINKITLLGLFFLMVACSNNEQAGFSSETTNGFTVVSANGQPAKGVRVRIFKSIDPITSDVYIDTILNDNNEFDWSRNLEEPLSLQLELKNEALFIKAFESDKQIDPIQMRPLLTKVWIDTLQIEKLTLGHTLFNSEKKGEDSLVLMAPEGEYELYFNVLQNVPQLKGKVIYGDGQTLYENTLSSVEELSQVSDLNTIETTSSEVNLVNAKWDLSWDSKEITLNRVWNKSFEIDVTSGNLDGKNSVDLKYLLDSTTFRYPLNLQEMKEICFLNSGDSDELSFYFVRKDVIVSKEITFIPTAHLTQRCFDSNSFNPRQQYVLFDEIRFQMSSGRSLSLDDLIIYDYNRGSLYQKKL